MSSNDANGQIFKIRINTNFGAGKKDVEGRVDNKEEGGLASHRDQER